MKDVGRMRTCIMLKLPVVIKDGYMELHEKPGLGVEMIDDAAKRFPFIPGRMEGLYGKLYHRKRR